MAHTVGTRLGRDDLTALLGAGGVGQVWQAADTQLHRDVALKMLPDAFAADPDRLARFQREARDPRFVVEDPPTGSRRKGSRRKSVRAGGDGDGCPRSRLVGGSQ